jgi:hypothetical protein
MTRAALILTAVLVLGWIVGSLFLFHRWTVNGLLANVAVWVDIPLAFWVGGAGLTAYRRARAARR